MKDIFTNPEFTIETVATGTFLDSPGGLEDKTFRVETRTVRFNHIALDEWDESQPTKLFEEFDTEDERRRDRAERDAKRERLTDKVRRALGFDDKGSFALAHVVGEIFTAVYITEAE